MIKLILDTIPPSCFASHRVEGLAWMDGRQFNNCLQQSKSHLNAKDICKYVFSVDSILMTPWGQIVYLLQGLVPEKPVQLFTYHIGSQKDLFGIMVQLFRSFCTKIFFNVTLQWQFWHLAKNISKFNLVKWKMEKKCQHV